VRYQTDLITQSVQTSIKGVLLFKHFLIPVDGSPSNQKAAKAGIALAHRLGAKVTAYCALEPLQLLYAESYAFMQKEYDGFDLRAREAGRKRVDAIGKMANAAGVQFSSVVAKADMAYRGIIAVAKKRKCDVIFMASHGRSGLSRLIMGSVTQKVLRHSKLPVVIYR
jgi:nucleotide-binding universal stress UspA family protein